MAGREKPGAMDDAQFEASLVAGDTEIVVPQAAPAKPAGLPKQPPWAGKVLGHFKLLRLIGEGKMGRVIQARDINLQRIVALKVLCKRLPGIDATRRVDQFFREARAAAQIDHPNVVHIYEINQHDGWWYIAMEMLEGGNLGQAIKAAGPLSVGKACAVVADAAAALAVAHEMGIIHRDIKPANLMLTRQGRCKVTDFGLVHMDDPNDPFHFTHNAVGSPLFMAPEMILRREQTPAVDVYSLGTTLFCALTGHAPYTGKSLEEVLKQHIKAPIPDLRASLPSCSQSLATLVTRTLAKSPSQRPSAAETTSALRAEAIAGAVVDSGSLSSGTSSLLRELMGSGVADSTIGTQIIAAAERWSRAKWAIRRRRALIGAGIAGLVALVVLLGLYGPFGRSSRPVPEPASLDKYFPDAPQTLGVLPAAAIPEPLRLDRDDPPAFSWVGRIDPGDARFVASRRGRRFYSIDAPEAILIRKEDVVGYPTAQAAVADGKISAAR
ncbi:MAG: serine/threonine-protein kinase [Sedimentisphaerales bacterium]|nr:serine/threonine-protein kinase [Sedimentisphaerales bacterium]